MTNCGYGAIGRAVVSDTSMKQIYEVQFWKSVEPCDYESIYFVTNFTRAKAFFISI